MAVRRGPLAMLLTLGAAALGAGSCRAAHALEVDPARAAELIRDHRADPDFVLLDLRTPPEFAAGHLEGAVNIDYYGAEFAARIGALDRSKTYLVYCRTGNRSGKALPLFDRLGFGSVIHLTHGIVAWQRQGLPLTPAAGPTQ